MLVVGLPGGIASGKTEVAKVLQKRGGIIVSGDRIGKEVVEKNKQVLNRLVKVFGKQILIRNEKLNRRRLGSLAFSSEKNQKRLNQIVHPHLLKELKKRITSAKKREAEGKFLVVDAALISEWGLEKELDLTVAVISAKKLRIQRLLKQGLSRKQAEDRVARQFSDRERIRKAEFVINNDGSLQKLKKKAIDLFNILRLLMTLDQMEKLVTGFDSRLRKPYI